MNIFKNVGYYSSVILYERGKLNKYATYHAYQWQYSVTVRNFNINMMTDQRTEVQ